MSNWKQTIADRAATVIAHDLVQDVCREQADNFRIPYSGLHQYGLEKIAIYAATVAIAQSLGINPDLLRLTPEEANAELMRAAAEAVGQGVPTFVLGDNDE